MSVSISVPRADENVFQSENASLMSLAQPTVRRAAARENARGCSLACLNTGCSRRITEYAENGSSKKRGVEDEVERFGHRWSPPARAVNGRYRRFPTRRTRRRTASPPRPPDRLPTPGGRPSSAGTLTPMTDDTVAPAVVDDPGPRARWRRRPFANHCLRCLARNESLSPNAGVMIHSKVAWLLSKAWEKLDGISLSSCRKRRQPSSARMSIMIAPPVRGNSSALKRRSGCDLRRLRRHLRAVCVGRCDFGRHGPAIEV